MHLVSETVTSYEKFVNQLQALIPVYISQIRQNHVARCYSKDLDEGIRMDQITTFDGKSINVKNMYKFTANLVDQFLISNHMVDTKYWHDKVRYIQSTVDDPLPSHHW